MDELSAFDLGYAVGLYEGEGTFASSRDNRRQRRYARLRIKMIDKEPLERMLIVGGFVRGPEISPKEAAKGYQPKFRWDVSTIDEVQRVARLFYPHLSPRRQRQFDTIFEALERNPTEVPAAKQFGSLVCPPEVIASARGYNRHRLLGIPACDICLASAALWAKENRAKHPSRKEKKAAYMREYFQRNKERLREYQRAWDAKDRARKRQEANLQLEVEGAPASQGMPSGLDS